MTTQPFIDPDAGKSPKQLLEERTRRLQDAIQLKQPDRVPIQMPIGYLASDMYGVSHQEQHENADREIEILENAALYFQPDSLMGVYNNPGPSLALGDRMTRFPGHDLSPNGSFQFVEGEYMKSEDYDDFIEDPADWGIRKYWPRVFSELEGLSMLPPLGISTFGTYSLSNLPVFKAPPVVKALRALARAIEAQAEAQERMIRTSQHLASLGFAPVIFAGVALEAPFDLMSDTLRGMRGIMLDMYRQPEKLLMAQEKVLRFQLEYAVSWCRFSGINVTFIPLHRGSDGFMSIHQFEDFYWPQLKTMLEQLVNENITPVVFYEGVWDERLQYLAELPKGKTVGWFQASDIFKTKEIVGDTMCIVGGMPNSLLKSGTREEVRQLTIRLCKEAGKGGGFIISTGVGEMEGCQPELVKVWVETTKEFGVYA
jgi:uroporphyrinogen-III decarboxylase